MIEDADVEKIATKLREIQIKATKLKEKKHLILILIGYGSFFLGALFMVGIYNIADSQDEKINQMKADAQEEIDLIQNMPCNELKTYTTKTANTNYVITEILQRCVG